MVIGLIFIFAGVLIALFPQILVALVSGLLIMIGCTILFIRWQFRHPFDTEQQASSPIRQFFMRW